MNQKIVFQKSNLKMTPSRMAVLSFLEESKTPLSADEILVHLNQEHEGADKATIYRILDAFTDKALITRLEFGEGKFRYEIAGSDHHHLICERCGAIEDISDCGVSTWEQEIKEKKNFLVKKHSLEFYGVCQSCQS